MGSDALIKLAPTVSPTERPRHVFHGIVVRPEAASFQLDTVTSRAVAQAAVGRFGPRLWIIFLPMLQQI